MPHPQPNLQVSPRVPRTPADVRHEVCGRPEALPVDGVEAAVSSEQDAGVEVSEDDVGGVVEAIGYRV